MGKKSREKRERKLNLGKAKPNILLDRFREEPSARQMEMSRHFDERLEATRALIRRYKRWDAAIALSVSELWPANSGSPFKHGFAWGVMLDLPGDEQGETPISSYADFKEFVQILYETWPDFSTLEDFPVQADWGQIKVRLDRDFVPMFYGSCLERTPDFVEAFRITYAHMPKAQAHMDLVVAVQARIVKSFPELRARFSEDSARAHAELPPEDFWLSCSAALLRIGEDVANWREKAGGALESTFGAFKAPLTWNGFGNAVMQGSALPFLAVVEDDRWLPIAVRSGPSVVLDHWAKQEGRGVSPDTHRRLGGFVAQRFSNTAVGPLTLVIGDTDFPDLPVSCIISADSGVYLICACDHASNKQAATAASNAYAEAHQGKRVQFRHDDGRILFLSKDGINGPSADELRIIIVVTQAGTAFGHLGIPERPARLLPLGDLISIFDSLEDLDHLERYWKFVDSQRGILSPFSTAPADLYAAFKDTHGVIVEGASSPTMIMLDPQWGTMWRFKELADFWSRAPAVFPDGSEGWLLTDGVEGVVDLKSRHHKAVAYSTVVRRSTVQTLVRVSQEMRLEDARLINLFAKLLADCAYRCRESMLDILLFEHPHVLFICDANPSFRSDEEPPEPIERFSRVVTSVKESEARKGVFYLRIDVRAVLSGLHGAKDASFEVRCLRETLASCCSVSGLAFPKDFDDRLRARGAELARYHLSVGVSRVDVPENVEPVVPSLTDYKLARKHLAMEIKELGLAPGRYELSEAKARIDPASTRLRLHIEGRLASFDKHQLLRACIEQHDALLVAERSKIQRARQSLKHAVDYDRVDAVESARKEFGSLARHYRYLLEKIVSSPASGEGDVTEDVLRELIGFVDWYMVLTGASDVLHNGMDVGGVVIDDTYIPEVFYSDGSDGRETEFAREYAKSRLDIDANSEDIVEGASKELLESEKLKTAFRADVGFELQSLITVLAVLSQAQRSGFGDELSLSYAAAPEQIVQVLVERIDRLEPAEAQSIVSFLTLSEKGVLRLFGRDVDEVEVPYWEHSKRTHRYAIRPLVVDGAQLRWGAEATSRSMYNWMSPVRDGYLPADFDWPNVGPLIREVKEGIEKRLEIRTTEIFGRHTPFVERGVDFYRRFRSERFDDVGDFDVFAYWPEENLLVTGECKYNQPTYTAKDGRRLRDRIFGKSESDRAGQFSRILGRRQFLEKNRSKLLELLKWPVPEGKSARHLELYVSRNVYYWMVHPPYRVPTKFVRVDTLDSWIQTEVINNLSA